MDWIQKAEDLIEYKTHTELKIAAENRNVWQRLRRDSHKPAEQEIMKRKRKKTHSAV